MIKRILSIALFILVAACVTHGQVDNPPDTTELDPVFTSWLGTGTYVVVEVDPYFTNWVTTATIVRVESDPYFTNWVATNTYITIATNLAALYTDLKVAPLAPTNRVNRFTEDQVFAGTGTQIKLVDSSLVLRFEDSNGTDGDIIYNGGIYYFGIDGATDPLQLSAGLVEVDGRISDVSDGDTYLNWGTSDVFEMFIGNHEFIQFTEAVGSRGNNIWIDREDITNICFIISGSDTAGTRRYLEWDGYEGTLSLGPTTNHFSSAPFSIGNTNSNGTAIEVIENANFQFGTNIQNTFEAMCDSSGRATNWQFRVWYSGGWSNILFNLL